MDGNQRKEIKAEDVTLEEKPIARGGFGVIYKGTLKIDDRPITVAVKQISPNPRIHDELSALDQLQHPTIVKYYGVYQNHGHYHLVMEYCKYGSLRDYMRSTGKPMQDLAACWVLRQLTSAVLHLHNMQIIHRDISPGNILISLKEFVEGFEKIQIKLCDFGLSKQLNPYEGRAKTIVGTPGFMAPDMLRPYSGAVDVYSMGCVLYFMLSGIEPRNRHITSIDLQKVQNFKAKELIHKMIADETKRIGLLDMRAEEFYRLLDSKNGLNSTRSSHQPDVRSNSIRNSRERPLQREDNITRSRRLSADRFCLPPRNPSSESRRRGCHVSKNESGYNSDQFPTKNLARSASIRPFETRRDHSLQPSYHSEGHRQINVWPTTSSDNGNTQWPLAFDQFNGMIIMCNGARYTIQGQHFFREALHNGYVIEIMLITIGKKKGQRVSFFQPMPNQKVETIFDARAKYDQESGEIFMNLETLQRSTRFGIYRRAFNSLKEFKKQSTVLVLCIHPKEFPDGRAEILRNGDHRIILSNGDCYYQRGKNGPIESIIEGKMKIIKDNATKESFLRLFDELERMTKSTVLPFPLRIKGSCKKDDCKWCSSESPARKPESRPIPTVQSTAMTSQENQSKQISNASRMPLRELPRNSERVEAPMKIDKIHGIPIVFWGKKTLRKSTKNTRHEEYVYRSDTDPERRFIYDGDMSKISDPDVAKMLRYFLRSLQEGKP